MKITKNGTLKKDIKATSAVKTQKQEKTWDSLDRDVDGKFLQPEVHVRGSKFTLPFSFPSLFLFPSKL